MGVGKETGFMARIFTVVQSSISQSSQPNVVGGLCGEDEKENKCQQKFSTVDTQAIAQELPSRMNDSAAMVFLFDKNGMWYRYMK